MKILCIADHIDPLVHSTNARERFKDVDLVLSAGDLPMEYLGFVASTLNKPVLFVFGNHNLKKMELFRRSLTPIQSGLDAEHITRHFYGSTYIGNTCIRTKTGLLIAGIGGSINYNNGENQFTDAQINLKLFKLIPRLLWNRVFHGRFLDILLTHSPPYGINDISDDPCHRGFKPFLWFMRWFKPKYLLHGHVHLYNSNDTRHACYEETQIINVYDHYVLKIEDV
jgi:Icc-related predicted phosphoesterase